MRSTVSWGRKGKQKQHHHCLGTYGANLVSVLALGCEAHRRRQSVSNGRCTIQYQIICQWNRKKKTRTERERESERERKGTEHVGRSEQMMSAWNCTRRISNNILYQEVPVERLVAAPVLVDQESFDRKGFGWSAFFYRHLTDYTRLIIPFCTLWAA